MEGVGANIRDLIESDYRGETGDEPRRPGCARIHTGRRERLRNPRQEKIVRLRNEKRNGKSKLNGLTF